jgi:hypothetical protein
VEPVVKFAIVLAREASLEAAMADHWRHAHQMPAEDVHDFGLESSAYLAGWALSCAAVLGVVLLVWHFHI